MGILVTWPPACKQLAATTRAHYNARNTMMSALMSEIDLASAALAALQPTSDKPPSPQHQELADCLRAKVVGVLLRQARLAAECSPEACADFLQMPPAQFAAWEAGEAAPSLPELELLSRFLQGAPTPQRQSDYLLLRQRIIGVQLQNAHQGAGSAQTTIPPDKLEAYLRGECRLPMTDLCALAQTWGVALSDFRETATTRRPVSALGAEQASDEGIRTASQADQQQAAFIRLAMAFRHINADDLQRIADALFAIIDARANHDLAETNAAP